MQEAIQISAFSWPRGEPGLWRIASNGLAEIVYEGGFLFENAYRPLEEAPRLYEDFAALGREAETAGRRLSDEVEKRDGIRAWTETEEGKKVLLPPADPVLYADLVPGIRDKALDFVRSHGPLRLPRNYKWPLADFLREAVELNEAMVLAKDMRERERGWEADDEGRKADAELSAMQFELWKVRTGYLAGARLIDHVDDAGRLAPAYSCTDLVSAIWLQFYEADNGSKSWRQCFGCGRLFVTTDIRQQRHKNVYHSPACRNRSHARRSSKKGA